MQGRRKPLRQVQVGARLAFLIHTYGLQVGGSNALVRAACFPVDGKPGGAALHSACRNNLLLSYSLAYELGRRTVTVPLSTKHVPKLAAEPGMHDARQLITPRWVLSCV